jgi:HSP20 family protein
MLPVPAFETGLSHWLPRRRGALARWPGHLDRVFEGFLDTPGWEGFRVDVRQDVHDCLIQADLPGLSKDDIDITVEDGVLTVTAESRNEAEDKDANYHVRERRYGRMSRAFKLPPGTDGENVAAELKDGVLTLRVPTREDARPRKIEVK